jgi:hypothetical protein
MAFRAESDIPQVKMGFDVMVAKMIVHSLACDSQVNIISFVGVRPWDIPSYEASRL